MPNYYNILGLQRNATERQIRARFRQLARQRHPDRFQGADKESAEEEFQKITEAFNVLTNSERRREHDLELARPESQRSGVDREQLAKVYLQRGVRAFRDKNYLEAADNFDRATKADSSNGQAWYNLALACEHQSRWRSRAIAAIEQAVELEPMKPQYLRAAGRIFGEAGMTSKALGFYEKAVTWGGEDDAIEREVQKLRDDKLARQGRSGRAE